MAVTGVVNLTELISNQPLAQSQDAPAAGPAAPAELTVAVAPIGDSFTPSNQTNPTQTAQDAGIFQVSQYALTSATAESLTTQTIAPAALQNPAPSANVFTTAAAPSVAAPPQATANAVAPVPANAQDQVQSLNTVLLGLGLSNSDIQDIDRIASVTNTYNPALYGDLIQQFEAQAEPQWSAPAPANQSVTQR